MADTTPPTSPVRPRPRWGRRIALAFVATLVLLVIAIISGGTWLSRSEGGSAWLLGQVPGLRVEGLRGALLGDELTAERLVYEHQGSMLELRRVRLQGLTGSWTARPRPGEPWLQIGLDALAAEQATWRSGPPSGAPVTAPTSLRLPLALRVKQATVGRLQVDTLPPLFELQTQLSLGDNGGARHTVQQLRFRTERLQAEAQGELATDAPMALQLKASARSLPGVSSAASAPSAPADWQAELALNGPLAALKAQAHLESAPMVAPAAPAVDNTKGGKNAKGKRTETVPRPPPARPALDAEATVTPFAAWPVSALDLRTKDLDLAALVAGAPRTQLRGEAHVRSSGMKAPADVDTTIVNDAAGRWDEGLLPLRRLTASAQGQPQALGDLQLRQFVLELGGATPGGELRGSGALQPAAGSERLQLKLALDGLRPAALDQRLPAMTLAGPLTMDLNGLPALDAPPPAASTASAPNPHPNANAAPVDPLERWHALFNGQLEGQLDRPAPSGKSNKSIGKRSTPAAATAANLPKVQLSLKAELNRREFKLTEALARAGDARASLTGTLTLGNATAPWDWKAQGELADFDPLLWWAGTTSTASRGATKLNARLDSGGRWVATGPSPLDGLTGQLDAALQPSQWAGVAVQGELSASRDGSGVARAKARLDGAGNKLVASGQDGGNAPRRVELNIEAPALSALAPWLNSLGAGDAAAWLPRAGALQAQADAQWDSASTAPPKWQAQLRGSALTNPAWHAARIEAQAQGQGLGDGPLNAKLSGDDLAWQLAQIDSLRAELKGSLREHQFNLQALSPARPPAWAEQLLGAHTGSGTRLQLAASGRWQPATEGSNPWDPGRWQGRVADIEGRASDGSGQPWLAAKELVLGLAWDDQGLTEAQAEPGRIALPGTALQWTEARYRADRSGSGADQIALDAKLDAFELAPLLARAQPELGWRGDLVLGGELKVRAADRFDADIVFERLRGDLSVADDVRDDATVHRALGLSDLRLGLSAHEGTWHFTAGLSGTQLGEMAGVASVRTTPQARWPGPEAPLSGVFQMHVAKLAAWGGWVPPGWRLGGDLQSAATLGGRWGAPELSGRLTGRQLEVRNGLQGVQFTNGTVDLAFNGDRVHVEQFDWRGGDGTLRVEGDAKLGRQPEADLTLKADKLRVLGRLDRRIIATGEALLALRPSSAQLTGKLRLDEGLIDFSRGGAPTLDDDVRVVGRPTQAPLPGEPGTDSQPAASTPPAPGAAEREFETKLDIALDLGPSLRVKGRGLDTFLRGTLHLSNPNRQLAVKGEVRTDRGTYRAYSQKLEISRGVLAFNGPIDDPRLDILAIRPNLDIEVGVAVTGSALNPRVRLASDPEMSDTDKLSWLVLGRAPDGLGRADSALLQRAAMALLAGEGEGPTDAFLANIGLSDFGVRQQGEGAEQTTVVSLGKQLTRRWYVGYERSVNATTGTWQLIYRIAQRFTLRAQSGEDSALDLIWSWRWN